MPSEMLPIKGVYLKNEDASLPQWQEHSLKIIDALKQEIWMGEFSKPIVYHGILDEEPDIDIEKARLVSRADNCVFPNLYYNLFFIRHILNQRLFSGM